MLTNIAKTLVNIQSMNSGKPTIPTSRFDTLSDSSEDGNSTDYKNKAKGKKNNKDENPKFRK